jgi:hypothetical protein
VYFLSIDGVERKDVPRRSALIAHSEGDPFVLEIRAIRVPWIDQMRRVGRPWNPRGASRYFIATSAAGAMGSGTRFFTGGIDCR